MLQDASHHEGTRRKEEQEELKRLAAEMSARQRLENHRAVLEAAAARAAASPLATLSWGPAESAVVDGQMDVAALAENEPWEPAKPQERYESHTLAGCREEELAHCA